MFDKKRSIFVYYKLIIKQLTRILLMFLKNQITDIYGIIDEFMLEFNQAASNNLIGKKPKRKPKMNTSEVLTIMILFQLSGVRNFKCFYLGYVTKHLTDDFQNLVSYNRFVELQKLAVLPLAIFTKTCCMGDCTGISFVDSTPLRVCKNKRIYNHKVFKNIATTGKSTMGWFFGFKLHLIVNEVGQVVDFQITQANVDNRIPLKEGNILKNIWGKLYGDKGYVSKTLGNTLFGQGIHLVTGIRKNMKNQVMELRDKILLRKRSVIETINDQLKNICNVEHSRHRSFHNFINNILSAIAAYSFLPQKPAIKYYEFTTDNSSQLLLNL